MVRLYAANFFSLEAGGVNRAFSAQCKSTKMAAELKSNVVEVIYCFEFAEVL